MSDPTTRRRFLLHAGLGAGALLASPALLGACGSDKSSAGPVTAATGPVSPPSSAPKTKLAIKNSLGWIKNVEFAGFWVADQKGFYDQEGIKPDWLAGGPNTPDPSVTVAGGGADIGTSASFTTLVEAVAKGSDLVMFAAIFQTSPGAILSLAKKPIRTVADLAKPGLRIGMQGSSVTVDTVLKLNGFTPAYEKVKVGFTPAPLIQGQCDAYTCYVTNQPLSLKAQGIGYVTLSYDAMGFPSYGNPMFAKREFIDKNRDAVIGYLRATIKGWELNEVDPKVGAALAVDNFGKDLGLSLSQQIEENKAQIELTKNALTASKGLLWIDKEKIAGPMFTALKASGISTLPDVDKFVDTSLLEAAYGGKTRLI